MVNKFNLTANILFASIALTACGGDNNKSSSSSVKPVTPTNPATPTNPTTPAVKEFSLASSAFKNGSAIPLEYACIGTGGQNISLPLEWSNVPKDTAKFAIVMDDETPPCETGDNACKHWGVYNLPASSTSVQKGQSVTSTLKTVAKITETKGVIEGGNYRGGEIGYAGMCPLNKHTYNISVYALKASMPNIEQDKAKLTRSQFSKQYAQHIIGEAKLNGTFEPK